MNWHMKSKVLKPAGKVPWFLSSPQASAELSVCFPHMSKHSEHNLWLDTCCLWGHKLGKFVEQLET
jgi:hypothetical protein